MVGPWPYRAFTPPLSPQPQCRGFSSLRGGSLANENCPIEAKRKAGRGGRPILATTYQPDSRGAVSCEQLSPLPRRRDGLAHGRRAVGLRRWRFVKSDPREPLLTVNVSVVEDTP